MLRLQIFQEAGQVDARIVTGFKRVYATRSILVAREFGIGRFDVIEACVSRSFDEHHQPLGSNCGLRGAGEWSTTSACFDRPSAWQLTQGFAQDVLFDP